MNGMDTRRSDAPRRRGSRSAALAGRPDRQRLRRRLLGRLRRRRSSGPRVRLTQLRGRNGHPPGMLLLVSCRCSSSAGWVLLAMQPDDTGSEPCPLVVGRPRDSRRRARRRHLARRARVRDRLRARRGARADAAPHRASRRRVRPHRGGRAADGRRRRRSSPSSPSRESRRHAGRAEERTVTR